MVSIKELFYLVTVDSNGKRTSEADGNSIDYDGITS